MFFFKLSVFLQSLKPNALNIKYFLALLISMHLAGFVGLQWNLSRPLFEALIPFNLLMTTAILLLFHRDWQKSFWFFMIITCLCGFFVEVLGVKTKLIFGDYQYETTLGIKFLEVPLLISLNWLVLVYVSGITANQLKINVLWKCLIGASAMVFLDYWIEPVAVRHQMWSWTNNYIPLQNYLAWFVVAYFLLLIFHLLPFQKQNRIAIPIYLAQLGFFLAHNLIYWFYLP